MPTFKVMTWNVENLYRPAPNAPQLDQDRFQQKIQLLAGVINELAPDVLGLQEIGGSNRCMTYSKLWAQDIRTQRSLNFRTRAEFAWRSCRSSLSRHRWTSSIFPKDRRSISTT